MSTAKLNISDIYLVKHNSNKFNPNTLVKYITCSYSGNCYLCADLDDDLKREWIMYYDLYPISLSKDDFQYRWIYNQNLNNIGSELISKYITV